MALRALGIHKHGVVVGGRCSRLPRALCTRYHGVVAGGFQDNDGWLVLNGDKVASVFPDRVILAITQPLNTEHPAPHLAIYSADLLAITSQVVPQELVNFFIDVLKRQSAVAEGVVITPRPHSSINLMKYSYQRNLVRVLFTEMMLNKPCFAFFQCRPYTLDQLPVR